jgi:acyl-ACP thioesterase
VDLNEHLNNSKYVDYITDCFTMDNYKRYNIKSIEVNYINEALPGDTLILKRDISGLNANVVYIEGTNEKDNKTVFKSQIEIQEDPYYADKQI